MGLFRRTKNNRQPLLRQIIELIPRHILQACIPRHRSDKCCSRYKTYDQLVSQMFGQLKAALIHTGWDDTPMLPTVINITPAATHDSKGFIQRIYEPGTVIVEDKGYYNFELFKARTEAKHAFSNFTEKMRICLPYYLSLNYVCNRICQGAKPITLKPPNLFSNQNQLSQCWRCFQNPF